MEIDLKKEYSDPSWNEIFQEIGKQLHVRSGLLTKRVLLTSAPALIILFIIQLFAQLSKTSSWFSQPNDAFDQLSIQVIFWGTLSVIIVLFITVILMSILKIEQIIWLNSYFDGKKLTPQESWRIARKLYWAWSYLQFKLFYRYYLWVVLSAVGSFVLWSYCFIFSDFAKFFSSGLVGFLSAVFIIIIGIGLVVWNRFLKIRLSYVPFLFLDRYQPEKAYSPKFWNEFFNESRELINVSKGESFKKNVMMEIGGDVALTFVNHIAGQIQTGFVLTSRVLPPVAGAVLEAVGTTASRAAGEVAYRVIYFAKLTGHSLLYHYAFKNIHGKDSVINEYIYSLKD